MFKNINCGDYHGIRLDRYLKKLYPDLTQGMIEKSLRKKKILLNGKKTQSNHKLLSTDTINIHDVVVENYSTTQTTQKHISLKAKILAQKMLGEYLVYASDKLLIINKPSGLAVQGGSKINLSIDQALAYLNHQQKTDYKLVHRLDKETSGLLVIAKNYQTARLMGKAFGDNLIKKTYIAILCGIPKQRKGIIKNYITKQQDKCYVAETATTDSKYAETAYKILNTQNGFAKVEYTPLTGRTHQLRVHSQWLGCPILGDVKYGGQKHTRMSLHAAQLTIPPSVLGYKVNTTSSPSF